MKTARTNIRMNESDMVRLRELSEKAGIPYQTLISHIIHLYVTNQLINAQEVKKMVEAVKATFKTRETEIPESFHEFARGLNLRQIESSWQSVLTRTRSKL